MSRLADRDFLFLGDKSACSQLLFNLLYSKEVKMNRLSKLVGHYRQQQNLNFEELAGLCGLNPKKWGHRIVDFERESWALENS